jgi:hypothetical protein
MNDGRRRGLERFAQPYQSLIFLVVALHSDIGVSSCLGLRNDRASALALGPGFQHCASARKHRRLCLCMAEHDDALSR